MANGRLIKIDTNHGCFPFLSQSRRRMDHSGDHGGHIAANEGERAARFKARYGSLIHKARCYGPTLPMPRPSHAAYPVTKSQARRIWLEAQRIDVSAPFGEGPEATRMAI